MATGLVPQFYIPLEHWPTWQFPASSSVYWESDIPKEGEFNWTFQTWLRLKESGFECPLVNRCPNDGVIVAHRDALPDDFVPSRRQYFVCIKPDRLPHPWAQFHVLQNPRDYLQRRLCQSNWPSATIPHWPQPCLKPRDPARGDRFENIGYVGLPVNLADELKNPEWSAWLGSQGLNWITRTEPATFNDLHDLDAIVAIRSFNGYGFSTKPATKLYNAWLAGIPIIVAPEFSFTAERKSDVDFIEVRHVEELKQAVLQLRDDPDLRKRMREQGALRAQDFSLPRIVAHWRRCLHGVVDVRAPRWLASTHHRAVFRTLRRAHRVASLARARLRQLRARKATVS